MYEHAPRTQPAGRPVVNGDAAAAQPEMSDVAASVRPTAPSASPPAADDGRDVAHDDLRHLADALAARTPTVYERVVKPVVDRVLAVLLLVVGSPLLALIALAVLVAVGRPVLIAQQRAGRDGEPFTMLKFRTMRHDRRVHRADRRRAERRRRRRLRGDARDDRRNGDRRVTHKTLDDPRHTRTGLLLRKLSLDELPQLCNVVMGDMSLVGPRPELAHLTKRFEPWQHARHLVRPGITGLWQTTERGDGLLLHECIDLDLRYIAELSARTDLAILLRTPIALLRNKGVI